LKSADEVLPHSLVSFHTLLRRPPFFHPAYQQ
jgi:hypothetical protein